MRRAATLSALLVTGFVLLVGATAPAAAHTNHAEADAQQSANGTLVVEWVFSELDGWLVVRADDGGEPGEVLGHRRLPTEPSFRTDQTVAIDDEAWTGQTGSRTVWVMLHSEERGEGFDPDDDPAATFLDSIAGSRITVEKADRPARVTAQAFSPQSASDGTVTLRRVELPERGFVAVHASDADVPTTATDDDLGRVVGTVALDGGVHRNVTVDLDDGFVAESEGTRVVQAVLYRGTGSFDADSTAPITAGGSTVSTGFGLNLTADSADSAPVEDHDAENTPHGTPHSHDGTASDASGSGVGAFGALVVFVVTAVVLGRRR